MLRSLCLSLFMLLGFAVIAQHKPAPHAGEIKLGLEKLDVLGSVLYFAAHPDDENTRLISWLAGDQKYRTAYLSLTRGDGGQNLIGNELGIELGMIRTQELLAARSLDKGEQFFSAAYDFGFSKTHPETFAFWDKEEILRESVWIIRSLRPDVIITRFPPDPRGGHGHHQASAILAHEAFLAAADPTRFPEQLDQTEVWQAKRLVWNTANFGGQNNTSDAQLKIEVGAFNPLLGISYGEMAAKSRSQHKSQGFGAASSRGNSVEYFEHVAGEKASGSIMDGVQTDWSRIPGSSQIQQLIGQINEDFRMDQPHLSIPALITLHGLIHQIDDDYWKQVKSQEIEDLILAAAGFYADSFTAHAEAVVGRELTINQELIVRNPVEAKVISMDGKLIDQTLVHNQVFRHQYKRLFPQISQPFWLENQGTAGRFDVQPEDFGRALSKDFPRTDILISVEGFQIAIEQPVMHRYVDPVRGEVHNPLTIIPALTAQTTQNTILMPATTETSRSMTVTFRSNDDQSSAVIQVDAPPGVRISPSQVTANFSQNDTWSQDFTIEVTAGTDHDAGVLRFLADGKPIKQYRRISYDHIPSVSWFPPLEVKIQPIDIDVPIHSVAYIPGAGDLIPEALRSIDVQVDVLNPSSLTLAALAPYDAVVVGVRAYNVHPQLYGFQSIFNQYVEQGGVFLVQYQVNARLSAENIGPFPFQVGRSRVTEEDAHVTFLLPDDPSLRFPNRISATDFEGWVQERGLYFVENPDQRFRQPLAMHDQNEPLHAGSLIIAPHGKGKFVYTTLSFFRQLPAGVPGAFRLFVNLLADEK